MRGLKVLVQGAFHIDPALDISLNSLMLGHNGDDMMVDPAIRQSFCCVSMNHIENN